MESLVALFESDKEMIMVSLRADASPKAAQAALERALDRLALRHAEQCDDRETRDAAQVILKALKSSLPLMGAVDDVKVWETAPAIASRRRYKPMTLGLMALGGVLELSTLLGLMLSGGKFGGFLTFIEALIPAALGLAAMFWAGLQAGRPEKGTSKASETRREFFIDPDAVWHQVRGMLLWTDSALEDMSAHRRPAESDPASTGPIDSRETELFSNLLESAYAQQNPDSREMIEAIRFYLHGAGIELMDYAEGREAWFEFLPAPQSSTLRPALLNGDRVVRKGLASR